MNEIYRQLAALRKTVCRIDRKGRARMLVFITRKCTTSLSRVSERSSYHDCSFAGRARMNWSKHDAGSNVATLTQHSAYMLREYAARYLQAWYQLGR